MEYWIFSLITLVLAIGLGLIEAWIGLFPNTDWFVLQTLYVLGTFIPQIAVTARRLHDTGKSAIWLLLFLPTSLTDFIPGLLVLISAGTLLIFCIQDSTPKKNKYGQNPKGKYSNKKRRRRIGRSSDQDLPQEAHEEGDETEPPSNQPNPS